MFTGITRDEQNEPTASFIRDMKFEKKEKELTWMSMWMRI